VSSRPCQPGCTCGRHQGHAHRCADDCTCGQHSKRSTGGRSVDPSSPHAAHNAKAKAQRAKREALLAADPTAAEHGKASTYGNWGCRCKLCLLAWRRERDNRRPDPRHHTDEAKRLISERLMAKAVAERYGEA